MDTRSGGERGGGELFGSPESFRPGDNDVVSFLHSDMCLHLLALWAPKFIVNSREFLLQSPLTKISAVFPLMCTVWPLDSPDSVRQLDFLKAAFRENGYRNQQIRQVLIHLRHSNCASLRLGLWMVGAFDYLSL